MLVPPRARLGTTVTKARSSMRRKKILIALSSLLALLVLLAVLAPTLLSGYVRGVAEREIAARVNGTVAIKAI